MTGVWFYYEDDLVRFIDMYREIIATRTYENAIERGMLVRLVVRPLGLFLANHYREWLRMFGSAMQAHMGACGVLVRDVEMLPPNGHMENYLVRTLTIMKFMDSTIIVHPTVWLGLRLC